MSILGYDVDGRPLKSGDRVLLVEGKPKFVGTTAIIVGKTDRARFYDELRGVDDFLQHDDGLFARASCCRRIDNRDDQPANQSFTQLMTDLKGRVSNSNEVVA